MNQLDICMVLDKMKDDILLIKLGSVAYILQSSYIDKSNKLI